MVAKGNIVGSIKKGKTICRQSILKYQNYATYSKTNNVYSFFLGVSVRIACAAHIAHASKVRGPRASAIQVGLFPLESRKCWELTHQSRKIRTKRKLVSWDSLQKQDDGLFFSFHRRSFCALEHL